MGLHAAGDPMVAGSILLDFIRQRRSGFRGRRQQGGRSLPRTVYERAQALFGRKLTGQFKRAGIILAGE